MTIAVNFLTIMAWIGLGLGGLVVVLRLVAAWYYRTDRLLRMQDWVKGVQRHFPIAVPFWIAVISVVFLLAKAMS